MIVFDKFIRLFTNEGQRPGSSHGRLNGR